MNQHLVPLAIIVSGCTAGGGLTLQDASSSDGGRTDSGTVSSDSEYLYDGNAEAGDETRFEGESSGEVGLEYPADNLLLPPNLPTLEFHFRSANGHDRYAMVVQGTSRTRTVVFSGSERSCRDEMCEVIYRPSSEVWSALSSLGNTTYRIRSAAATGGFHESPERTMDFAAEKIEGGLYWWSVSGFGDGAIWRYDFGRNLGAAERFIDGDNTGTIDSDLRADCVGCHAITQAGDRLAVSYLGAIGIFQTETGEAVWERALDFSRFDFSPDGASLAGASQTGDVIIVSAADGSEVASIELPVEGTEGIPGGLPGEGEGEDGAGGGVVAGPTFGNVYDLAWHSDDRMLVATSEGLFPVVRGDGDWSVGDAIEVPGGQDIEYFGMARGGRYALFTPTRDTGEGNRDIYFYDLEEETVARLPTSSDGDDTWAKFVPRQYQNGDSPLLWFTVSSTRAYGFHYDTDEREPMLWMGAVDPSAGAEGARPMFALPFVEVGSRNHIGMWALSVSRPGCVQDDDCASGNRCLQNECVPILD